MRIQERLVFDNIIYIKIYHVLIYINIYNILIIYINIIVL